MSLFKTSNSSQGLAGGSFSKECSNCYIEAHIYKKGKQWWYKEKNCHGATRSYKPRAKSNEISKCKLRIAPLKDWSTSPSTIMSIILGGTIMSSTNLANFDSAAWQSERKCAWHGIKDMARKLKYP